jgi:hypothetical protein
MTEILLLFAVLLLAANLILEILIGSRIRRAIQDLTRQTREIGLARLEVKREELARSVTVSPQDVVPLLARLAMEATGEQSGIDQVIGISATPSPAIIALGRDFAHYIFSPTPPETARRTMGGILGDRPRKVPAYPIDATTSGLALAELAAIWNILALENGLPVDQRVLPRVHQWYLYIVPQPRGRKPLQ